MILGVTGSQAIMAAAPPVDDGPIQGVNFADSMTPWLQIASLACVNNGLMCGSFFFRTSSDVGLGTVLWAAEATSSGSKSYLETDYFFTGSEFVPTFNGGLVQGSNHVYANSSQFTDDAVHHCCFSMDATRGSSDNQVIYYIDGVKVSTIVAGRTSGAFTPVFNGSGFVIGSQWLDASVNPFFGDIWRLWLAPGQSLHETDNTILDATILKFRKVDGTPEDLGSDGSTPTGVAPAIYCDGGADNFGTNLGTGGALTQTRTFTTVDFP